MKIYIVTTHFANNMGALLQCYALSKHLNLIKDVECQVLNYLPKDDDLSWKFWPKPECFKDIFKNLASMMPNKLICRIRKNNLMRSFINNYLPVTTEKYRRCDILSAPPAADAYICGSDQIWNFRLFNDLTYYLDFCNLPNTRRISYAASITEFWDDKQRNLVKPYLQKFDTLTIRDRNYVDPVSRLAGKKVHLVCDPVFLLDKDEWCSFANEEKCPKEPYILCYFISVPEIAIEAVKKLRMKTGYKVVHLNVNVRDRFHADINIRVADPRDFVGLIKNASYICTNSFHCTSFSIIFKKEFMFLKGVKDERAETLKDIFKLSNVIMDKSAIDDISNTDFHVNYTAGKESGEKFILESKQILQDSLWEI